MQTITWLHLSDLHFRQNDEYNQNRVLDALWEDIRKRTTRISPDLEHIDFICFTGDIAYYSKTEEYKLAVEHFFQPLLTNTGLDWDKLFIVLGNHDIVQDSVTPGAKVIGDTLQTREQITEFMNTPNDRKLVFDRLQEYIDFFHKQFPHISLNEEFGYFYNAFPTVRTDKKVAIIGLNSAWLCYGGKEDKGKLAVGEIQVYKALEQAKKADIRLCLMHHPFEWLKDNDDRQSVERLLRKQCHFLLRGHLHRPNVQKVSNLEGEIIIIPAGAVYDDRKSPLGYNFVCLNLDAGKVVVYLRRYNDGMGEWGRDTDSTGDELDGQISFDLPGLSSETRKKVPGNKSGLTDDGQDKFNIPSVEREIDADLDNFVGREEFFTEVEQFLQTYPCGYLFITGPPGQGKSAAMAKLVREKNYIHHFISETDNRNKPTRFLQFLLWQLRQAGDSDVIIPDREQDVLETFSQTLNRKSKQQEGEKLVIVLDGLDELTRSGVPTSLDFLPPRLPKGVYFIITSQPDPLVGMLYDRIQPDHRKTYSLLPLSTQEVKQLLNERGVNDLSDSEIQILNDRFKGLPILFVLFGKEQRDNPLISVHDAPTEISGYFSRLIKRFEKEPKPQQEVLYNVLKVFAVAKASITPKMLYNILSFDGKLPIDMLRMVSKILPKIQPYLLGSESQGFYLFNREFQNHILKNMGERDTKNSHLLLANWAMSQQESPSRYADEHLVEHLYKAENFEKMFSFITCNYLEDKFTRLRSHQAVLDDIHLCIQAAIKQKNLLMIVRFSQMYQECKHKALSQTLELARQKDYKLALQNAKLRNDERQKFLEFLFIAWEAVEKGNTTDAEQAVNDALKVPFVQIFEEDVGIISCILRSLLKHGIMQALQLIRMNNADDLFREFLQSPPIPPNMLQNACDYALNTAHKMTDRDIRSRALVAIAEAFAKLGKSDEAKKILEEAEQTAKNITDAKIRGKALIAIAKGFAKIKECERAKTILSDLQSVERNIREEYLRCMALVDLAEGFVEAGDASAAEEMLAKAKDIAQVITDKQNCCNAQIAIAKVLNTMGNSPSAKKTLYQAKEVVPQIVGKGRRFNAQVAVAEAFVKIGESDLGTEMLSQCFDAARELITEHYTDYELLIVITKGLVKGFTSAYEHPRAKEVLKEALEIVRSIPHSNQQYERHKAQISIAVAVAIAGESSDAIDMLSQIHETAQKVEDEYFRSRTLVSVAEGFITAGEYTRAKCALFKAKETIQVISDQFNSFKVLIGIVEGFVRIGEYCHAHNIALEIPIKYTRSIALMMVAEGFTKAGNYSEAKEVLSQALGTPEEIQDIYKRDSALIDAIEELSLALRDIPDEQKRFTAQITVKELFAVTREYSIALDFAMRIRDRDSRYTAFIAIAEGFAQIGECYDAKKVFNKALNLIEKTGGQSRYYDRSALLSAIVKAAVEKREYSVAEEMLSQVHKAAQVIPDDYYRAMVLAAVAESWVEAGNPSKAKEILDEAQEASQNVSDEYFRRKVESALAGGFIAVKDTSAAKEALDKVLNAALQLEEPLRSKALISVVRGFSEAGEDSQADDVVEQIPDFVNRSEAFKNIALVSASMGNAERALSLFKEKVSLTHRIECIPDLVEIFAEQRDEEHLLSLLPDAIEDAYALTQVLVALIRLCSDTEILRKVKDELDNAQALAFRESSAQVWGFTPRDW